MPRVAEALAIAEAAPIHAMIDLSDGLASDLGHILEESGGLGATLDAGVDPDPRRRPRSASTAATRSTMPSTTARTSSSA